jgi:hypothetical protein
MPVSYNAAEEWTLEHANERSQLIKRQKELEEAMKRVGGARVTEEQELHAVRHKLGAINAAGPTADAASRALRCSLADFTPQSLDPCATATAKNR